jgi:CRISPR-associated protein Cmr6
MSKAKKPFEIALEKALQAKPEKAQQLGLEMTNQNPVHGRKLEVSQDTGSTQGLQEPPMMYRAQVQGRCNLQFAGDKGKNPDRTQWMQEWLQSGNSREPRYRHSYEADGDKTKTPIYSFTIEFPYRVFSNSGQDSILCPVLGKNGIPYIPGSSVKGLLKRLCHSTTLSAANNALIYAYCGDEEKPGVLRFHGAFPIGNWANQIVDVVHPQQPRQVEDNTPGSSFALLSFYKPTLAFEFSSADSSIDWPQVESLVKQALSLGLGGKTSTGYGFVDKPGYANPNLPEYATAHHISLSGQGVSSLLLNGEPEFRPNLFKASFRGHISRLLGGVCNSSNRVEQEVNRLLGSSDNEGSLKLFWQFNQKSLEFENKGNSTYKIQGSLHLNAELRTDLDFLKQVLKFAYTMGGFGKSWRRVWHHRFNLEYYKRGTKFPIGCHWESHELNWINPQEKPPVEQLKTFLQSIHKDCFKRLSPGSAASVETATSIIAWRESFHPSRVAVYCSQKPTPQSAAIHLFHDSCFKTTPAVGGKKPTDQRPTSVSCVWHRMLPIGKDSNNQDQYLEIVTVFYGDRAPWQRNGIDQLHPFINQLIAKGLTLAWGSSPPP